MSHLRSFFCGVIAAGALLNVGVVAVAHNTPYQPEGGERITDSHGVEMVYIPGRVFNVGISNRRAIAFCQKYQASSETDRCVDGLREYTGATYTDTVRLQSFWIDRYEMTFEVFNELCVAYGADGLGPCKTDDFVPESLHQNEQQPVVGVTWFTALQVCAARNARLPTEAEWEYAARGPNQFFFPWGDDYFDDVSYAPSLGQSTRTTYSVGSHKENVSWAGVYDLAGNAAEWTEDRYIKRILANVSEANWPTADTFNEIELSRVVKGGSWISDPGGVATFYRDRALPSDASQYIGFRCARSLPPG